MGWLIDQVHLERAKAEKATQTSSDKKATTAAQIKKYLSNDLYPPLFGKSPVKQDWADRLDAVYGYWVGVRAGKNDVLGLGGKGKSAPVKAKAPSKKASTPKKSGKTK